MNLKTLSIAIVAVLFLILAVGFGYFIAQKFDTPIEKKITTIIERPLEKYTFENLRKTEFSAKSITLGRILEEEDDIISQMFYLDGVSGLLNVPKTEGTYPVILMARGFVPKEDFTTGMGTKRAAQEFVRNGFITLSPDFLDYGESDKPSKDAIEERLQTYTTFLTLISSLENLNSGLDASYSGKIKADIEKVGIWGHSNGGQIALSTLAISGKTFPSVLWAPVSKPFPYSILYFTDEFEDHGKALRKVLANFEKYYNIELYSPSNFYSWIQAPLQIHQGIDDEEVPKKWSESLVEELEKLEKDVEYFVYPNSDHNLMPNGWERAVFESMAFYRKHFDDNP